MIIGSMIIRTTSSKTMELNFDCFEQYLGQGFTRLFFKITNYIPGLDRGGWYGPYHCILQNFTASFIYQGAKHIFEFTRTWILSCSNMAIFDELQILTA